MSLSMYQASVPVFIRSLTNLSTLLDKAAADAAARGIDPAVFIADRLAPDMLPMSRQVQIACDGALRGGARLAGVEFPSNPDTETTFDELKARIAKTVAFLEALKPEQIDGGEERPVTIPMRDGPLTLSSQDLLLSFVLPNLFFHVTAAYLILRHNGVQLGKSDFIGPR